jgi:cystathionine gamma-lyase
MAEKTDRAFHKIDYTNMGFGTRAIHAGQAPDPVSGAVITPLSLATTFQQISPGIGTGFEYSRTNNPTRQTFEHNVASCENGKYGLAFASGSAATVTITNLLQSGDHVVSGDDVYGGTFRYFTKVSSKFGVQFSFIDLTDATKLEAVITPKTKMLWIETPTNPLLKMFDIRALSIIAKKHNLLFVVDNTFMSPYYQNPLDLGADIVVHSVSKYINGHSDVIMGVLATNDEELYKKLKFLQNSIGAIPSPFDSFMALRGMKTLHVRMKQHTENAQKIAEFLEQHPKVQKTIYPGLRSHPQYELGLRQMRGAGGMITFFVKGGINESRAFLENLKVFALAESLGGVESLVDHPAIMTHASVPPEERAKLGISDNLIRLSVGIEDVGDLLEDLKQALDHVPTAN